MNINEMRALIRQCSADAQLLIHDLHDREPGNETFSQVGLLDGDQIVKEYLDHNEFGIALDHVLYMVHESDICFDPQSVLALHALAEKLKIDNHYTAANLASLGVTSAFNVPNPR
ncbi:MAG: hypothetical protein AAF564_12285 [Bacteroidota bacterium]